MRYHDPEPITRAEAERRCTSDEGLVLSNTLVSVALQDSDWRWVQSVCLRFARDPDPGVRSTAALCFGHLARTHRTLDLDIVLPILRELTRKPETSGQAGDALDDIEMYLGKKLARCEANLG